MKKYIGRLMNSFTDVNMYRISEELLKDVFERQPQVPVTINFNHNPIGSTKRFFVQDDAILCEFEIDETKLPPHLTYAYIVPGLENVESHEENRVRVIDKGDLNEVSISTLPANQHLKPILLKGEK